MKLNRPRLTAPRARPIVLALVVAALLLTGAYSDQAAAQDTEAPRYHGFAMHGEAKYGPDFTHLDYVNPDAPKGGEITLVAIGTFNTFNEFILEGDSYDTSSGGSRRFYETLTEQSNDEAFSQYCLLCEWMEIPDDRSYVTFKLRDEAHWSDGTPVTADDLIFSYEVIRDKGHPFYIDYWKSIVTATKVDELTVRLDFDPAEKQNRELPLIAGQMPVLQQAWWEGREFDVPTVEVPISSGPYTIVDVEPGSSFAFERDPNYWGNDLPLNVGRFNFDRIRVDYYRDPTVALEAFKSGEFDIQFENNSKNWATAYDFPAVGAGQVSLENIPNKNVNGMQGFFFNQRRDLFKDREVRKALTYAFDFEWSNKNLFYDQYTRTASYWDNSELANPPGPPEGKMAEYLEPWRADLPAEVYEVKYEPPSTGGTEDGLRENITTALGILEAAGWTVNDAGALVNEAGEPFEFEILLSSSSWERIAQPFIDNLARLGIVATMRTVDASQYETLVENFEYDMLVYNRGMSPSPGNEQRNYWTCQSAETTGSQNYWGVCNPAIDQLAENVIQAESRDDLVAATQALDRALTWEYLCVPHWHIRSTRVAFWNVVAHPEVAADYGIDLNAWWFNADEAATVREAQAQLEFVEPTEEGAVAEPVTEPVTTTEEMTITEEAAVPSAEEGESGGGGFPGGPIGIAVAVIVLVGLVYGYMRSRQ